MMPPLRWLGLSGLCLLLWLLQGCAATHVPPPWQVAGVQRITNSAGQNAARRVENFDVSDLTCQIACQIPRAIWKLLSVSS